MPCQLEMKIRILQKKKTKNPPLILLNSFCSQSTIPFVSMVDTQTNPTYVESFNSCAFGVYLNGKIEFIY